ncbi:hypothetical protein RFI_20923, partial [Reticulomyxa filosa]
YLKMVAAGGWVLCFDWVDECIKQGKLVNETPFEIVGDIKGESGAKKSRKDRENKKDEGLFHNCVAIISDELKTGNLSQDLKTVFRLGGAKILNCLPYKWEKEQKSKRKQISKENSKVYVFVYDAENFDLSKRQSQFCKQFGILKTQKIQTFKLLLWYHYLNKVYFKKMRGKCISHIIILASLRPFFHVF